MESGLEGRNNRPLWNEFVAGLIGRLNGVRPRRPEQSDVADLCDGMHARWSQWSPA